MTELADSTIDLLQHLIRNECVNDGTAESGNELRSVDLLDSYLAGTGLDIERYEPAPAAAVRWWHASRDPIRRLRRSA